MPSPGLLGRLGDPSMSLATDSRTHPGQLRALKALGLHETSYLTSDLSIDSPLGAIAAFARGNEKSLESLYHQLDYSVQGEEVDVPLVKAEEVVPGPAGNPLRLFITRPAASVGRTGAPALVYLHGGGMIMIETSSPFHTTWAESLARTGFVVVTVDFRNGLGRDGEAGLCPFPAGLDDCAAAVGWVDAHRARLGVDRVVLQGESGGANLALAVALRAKREGWVAAIDGVCATSPYISNAYHLPDEWKRRELPSLVECNGYLISACTSALNAKLYDPTGANARNPLAWPYWAAQDDLEGLPPHFVSVNELDPLRDEGVAYYNKLARAGVRVIGKVNLGMVHVAEMFLRNVMPDVYLDNLWAIRKFADRLGSK